MIQFNQPYNREEFTNFLRRDFLPDDFEQEESSISFATQTKYSKQATKLGVCKSLDLVVYEINHCGKDDPRVGLSKESFRLLAEEWQNRALIIFVPEDSFANYRFSLIEIKLEGQKDSSKLERKYSNPRRYSYLLGAGLGDRTPKQYLAKVDKAENPTKINNYDDLISRFSVEVLTKAFYAELSEWYAWAIDTVTFPGEQSIEEKDKRNEHRSKNVIRLLTRLLFVWFLKQKQLIPDELFDEEYLKNNILKDFNPNQKDGFFDHKSLDSVYYKAILQNLFFATLNCPIVPQSAEDKRERGFRKSDWYGQDYGNLSAMRYKNLFSNADKFLYIVNSKVPFLNGGLFDCLDIRDDKENNVTRVDVDGFSDNLPKPNKLIVPDYLFFGETAGKGKDLSGYFNDKKKKSVDVLGLLDILKKYNFTIEENTPFDQDVSLDPELLGKVFENLLASYNPETKTTARKQTGSFYTPREIVQYMVDESLVAHLKRTIGDEHEEEYRKLMRYTDEPTTLNDEQQRSIIQSLQNCKVLDPACGSGAFPVGVLQQMVHILSQLDPGNNIWKNLILENSIRELGTTLLDCSDEERKESQEDINRNFDDNIDRPNYARKLYLIENCIYGVDIQPIAIQISKLRFFISLVVDQKPTTDAKNNFGIRTLPNLEAKFVAANTLIGMNKGERNLFDNIEVEKLQKKLIQASHRIFGAKSNKTKNKYKAKVEELQNEIAEKLLECGDVGNDDARLMREWHMFDQNASSPFFDPEWMFGVSGGFDIIIANPPYIGSKGNEHIFHDICKTAKGEQYYSRWMDYFYFFFHFGIDYLSANGILCYITTNYFYTATGADKLRCHLKDNTINTIVDFGEAKLFESALGQHNAITIISKNTNSNYATQVIRISERGYMKNADIQNALNANNPNTNRYYIPKNKLYTSEDNQIVIGCIPDNLTSDIISKILSETVPLGQIALVTMGIVTLSDCISNKHILEYGLKDVEKGAGIYVLSNQEMQALKLDGTCMKFIKPFYKNSDIQRYYTPHKNSKWIIYVKDEGSPIHLPPQLYSHFEKYKKIIITLKENFLKNDIAASVVKKWLKNGNYFVLFTPKKEEYFTCEKIIAPYRAKLNVFSYSNEDWFASKDVAYIIPKVNAKYILAILNSKLIYYWLNIRGKKKGDILELYAKPLNDIPIKNSSDKTPIINLVEKILEAKKLDPTTDTTALENEIDFLVYKLYGLSYDEVLIIDPKTPIAKQQYER